LVASEESGELLTSMLKLDDLLLQGLVDPSDRSAEPNRVSVEEIADLSEGDACIGKDLDPYEIDNGLGTVAAITRVIPYRLW
jgi:hypothetical protein